MNLIPYNPFEGIWLVDVLRVSRHWGGPKNHERLAMFSKLETIHWRDWSFFQVLSLPNLSLVGGGELMNDSVFEVSQLYVNYDGSW